jgi:hypothetical protein
MISSRRRAAVFASLAAREELERGRDDQAKDALVWTTIPSTIIMSGRSGESGSLVMALAFRANDAILVAPGRQRKS